MAVIILSLLSKYNGQQKIQQSLEKCTFSPGYEKDLVQCWGIYFRYL
jgi:hypothetical protein